MQPSRKGPLFVVSGASCVGKSTMCEHLFRDEKDYIVLESDLLWEDRFNTPEDQYRAYRRMWMRLCAEVSQIGKPVVLCGCGLLEQFEPLPERGLFTAIHYLALVCGDEPLLSRAREGRGVQDEAWLNSSLSFNRWLRTNAPRTQPPITLLDTTACSPREAARIADQWIHERL